MKIGMIGAGSVALAIAKYSLALGHEVLLSSRSGVAALSSKIQGLGANAFAVEVQEAANADVVILATPWNDVANALSGIGNWDGRILIDATNPFTQTSPTHVLADLGDQGASEVVAKLAPGARVVKAFNSVLMEHFTAGPKKENARRILLVSGDDAAAKDDVKKLIGSFGFACVDLGGLVVGGRMQQAGGPLAGLDLLVAD